MSKRVDKIVEQLETPIETSVGALANPRDRPFPNRVDFAQAFVQRMLRITAITAKNLMYENGYPQAAQGYSMNDQTTIHKLYELGYYIADNWNVGAGAIDVPEEIKKDIYATPKEM